MLPASPLIFHSKFSFSDAFFVQARVLHALILREMRTRFGELKLGYVWAFLEPVCHIAILSWTYAAFSRFAPIGQSLELFFITGLMPYFFYDKTATRLAGAITANKALLNLPIVRNLDVILARAFLELSTLTIVLILLLASLHLMGIVEAWPHNILTLMGAIVAAWMLGAGIGSINAVLNMLFKSWDNIFRLLTRPLYLLSGIFFMVEKLPHFISQYLLYNPVLHAVEWFRSAFYPGYGHYSVDKMYLLSWGIGSFLIGCTLERKLRKRLYGGRLTGAQNGAETLYFSAYIDVQGFF